MQRVVEGFILTVVVALGVTWLLYWNPAVTGLVGVSVAVVVPTVGADLWDWMRKQRGRMRG